MNHRRLPFRGAFAAALLAVLGAVHLAAAATSAAAAAAVPAAASEDIRDIRGAKFVVSTWLIPELLAGVAVLALLVYGIWRWRRRRQRPRVLLPFEIALQKLEALRPRMQPGHAREFSIAASDIVRGYIEARFSVTAAHRTTEEFLHDLLTSTHVSLVRHRSLLEEFLNQCDWVKFAGMALSVQTMESLHHSAVVFVKETAAPDPQSQQSQQPNSQGGQ